MLFQARSQLTAMLITFVALHSKPVKSMQLSCDSFGG